MHEPFPPARHAPVIAAWVILMAVFTSTASKALPYGIDPMANVLTAWSIADRGTPILNGFEELSRPENRGKVAFLVSSSRGPVSQYPPGAALWGSLFYLLDGQTPTARATSFKTHWPRPLVYEVPSLVPAAVAAATAAATAVTVLVVLIGDLGATRREQIAFALIAGFGTSLWSVASDALWQHGPAAMWIALGLLAAHRKHPIPAGLAFGLATLTRPHTLIIGLTIAALWTLQRRPRHALGLAIPALAGLAALIAYNTWLFGHPSISGGYGDGFTQNALTRGIGWYLANLTKAALSPTYGFLIWSPFLIILIPGLRAAWRNATPETRAAAIGGLCYLLIQYRANRASGGGGFAFYRYPIEGLTAAAPLLYLSHRHWIAHHPLRTRTFHIATLTAITTHTIAAFLG